MLYCSHVALVVFFCSYSRSVSVLFVVHCTVGAAVVCANKHIHSFITVLKVIKVKGHVWLGGVTCHVGIVGPSVRFGNGLLLIVSHCLLLVLVSMSL